ncbi:hypothetical protein [Methyloceanibacter caenitepidi]|uniref:Uncharacterized protein n=1 Tax=Methyloceanibacter caenitepidi TaxID=1384459 RepID=A0A0A8K0J7_9HYPH|nr:hypothetical protein [Methyloceanibacter caenitepidi]BAQ16311.1 hypothetical protein GL4_0849 [Methyloceanibacter caenitepidi]
MRRRPTSAGWPPLENESIEANDGGIDEIADPDPTVNFPQWSRTLLLLLDYAIIEGLQHRQHNFVHYLKLAEAELSKVLADSVECEDSDVGEEAPSPSKAH